MLDSEAGSSRTVRMPDGITISHEGEGEVLHMELQGGLDGGTMTGAPALRVPVDTLYCYLKLLIHRIDSLIFISTFSVRQILESWSTAIVIVDQCKSSLSVLWVKRWGGSLQACKGTQNN